MIERRVPGEGLRLPSPHEALTAVVDAALTDLTPASTGEALLLRQAAELAASLLGEAPDQAAR